MKAQLKTYQLRTKQWWHKRETREQRLLLAMAVLLVVAFFWYGLWQPLNTRIEQGQNRVTAQQETLRWVVENTARVEAARDAAPQRRAEPLPADELNAFISRKSEEHGLEVSRLQPQNETVLVVFNEVEFNALLAFLADLDARDVRVDAIDIAEAGEPGMVRVRRLQVRAQS